MTDPPTYTEHLVADGVDLILCLTEPLTDDEREAVLIQYEMSVAQAQNDLERIADLEHRADRLGPSHD